jgi:hypothetical protein
MFRDSILWGNSRVPVTLNKVIIRMRVKLKSLDVSRFDPLGKPEGSSHPKHGYHSYEGQIEVTQNFTTEARFPYAEREFQNLGEGIEMGQSQYTANILRNLNMDSEPVEGEEPLGCGNSYWDSPFAFTEAPGGWYVVR